jgi:hypothetical protein
MPLGPQELCFGNLQSTWLLTVTLTPVQTNSGTYVEQTFTVPGLQTGDEVSVAANFASTTLVLIGNARVSAANTIAIAFANPTAGNLTYPTGTFNIEVNRPDPSFVMKGIQ